MLLLHRLNLSKSAMTEAMLPIIAEDGRAGHLTKTVMSASMAWRRGAGARARVRGRAAGAGCRGAGCRVQGRAGCRLQGCRCRAQGAGRAARGSRAVQARCWVRPEPPPAASRDAAQPRGRGRGDL